VKDGENLNVAGGHTIGHDVRGVGDHKLSRPGDPARSAQMRMFAQSLDRADNAHRKASSSTRVVTPYEIGDRFKIG
jgi:hypothetical protein